MHNPTPTQPPTAQALAEEAINKIIDYGQTVGAFDRADIAGMEISAILTPVLAKLAGERDAARSAYDTMFAIHATVLFDLSTTRAQLKTANELLGEVDKQAVVQSDGLTGETVLEAATRPLRHGTVQAIRTHLTQSKQ